MKRGGLKEEKDKTSFPYIKQNLLEDLQREKDFLVKEESSITKVASSVFSFFGWQSFRQRMEHFYAKCEKSQNEAELTSCFSGEKHDGFYQEYLEEYANRNSISLSLKNKA